MEKQKTRDELISYLLADHTGEQVEEEEMLHLLMEQKLSKNTDKQSDDNLSFGAKAADAIAKFAGSWVFIIIFVSCLIFWMILNAVMLVRPFDQYPFILLNLLLSCVAALQAPVIMMSQNRQEEKDRLRAQNDYQTNLKTEILIEDLHHKLDTILENQDLLMKGVAVAAENEEPEEK